jgi:hypothetical protein
MRLRVLAMTLVFVAVGTVAGAADVAVMGLKLIIVDKGVSGGKAVFVAKDPGITKGASTDTATIFAELGIAYDSTQGVFTMAPGAGWIVNKETVAKYVNNAAPSGGAVKVSVIKPGALIKVVGKSLGDTAIDISSAPTGDVYVSHSVLNGDTASRHCTRFGTCSHKLIAGGTGYKLVCKGDSTGDPSCLGAPPPVCCDLTDPATLCTFVPSALACMAAGGTPGASGSSCDSLSGTCALVAAAGGCCEGVPTPFGDICLAGPAMAAPEDCPGAYSGSALCSPNGSCL